MKVDWKHRTTWEEEKRESFRLLSLDGTRYLNVFLGNVHSVTFSASDAKALRDKLIELYPVEQPLQFSAGYDDDLDQWTVVTLQSGVYARTADKVAAEQIAAAMNAAEAVR